MLPKINRLTTREVDSVFLSGRMFQGSFFAVKFLDKSEIDGYKAGVSAPKNVFKKAVERNAVRRLVYEMIHKLEPALPKGFFMVVVKKRYRTEGDKVSLFNDLKKLFNLLRVRSNEL